MREHGFEETQLVSLLTGEVVEARQRGTQYQAFGRMCIRGSCAWKMRLRQNHRSKINTDRVPTSDQSSSNRNFDPHLRTFCRYLNSSSWGKHRQGLLCEGTWQILFNSLSFLPGNFTSEPPVGRHSCSVILTTNLFSTEESVIHHHNHTPHRNPSYHTFTFT